MEAMRNPAATGKHRVLRLPRLWVAPGVSGVLHPRRPSAQPSLEADNTMSKGMERKKEAKKKPALSLKEKRAAKAGKEKKPD